MGKPRQEDLIANALDWVRRFTDIGIPGDLMQADAVVNEVAVSRTAIESAGPLRWTEPAWTVTLRKTWQVELDALGIPTDPPRRLH